MAVRRAGWSKLGAPENIALLPGRGVHYITRKEIAVDGGFTAAGV